MPQDRSSTKVGGVRKKGITLVERLLFEYAYFKETEEHLDMKNGTICEGSCRSDGSFAVVRSSFDRKEVMIRRAGPMDRQDDWFARTVIA